MLKVAGIEGVGAGAEVHWEHEWSGSSASPNVFSMNDRVVVTDNAIPGSPAVSLSDGVLTLTPTVTCGSDTVELDPIALNVGVDLVPMNWQCPPCYEYPYDSYDPDPDQQLGQMAFFLMNPNDGSWHFLGRGNVTLPPGNPLYLAYGAESNSMSGYWLTPDFIGNYDVTGATARSFPPSAITTGYIPAPSGAYSVGPTIPVGYLYLDGSDYVCVSSGDPNIGEACASR